MKQPVKRETGKEAASTTIHGMSQDGRGIATINNKTTFISGALPSETVTYKVTQKRSRYNVAQMLEVLIPSPTRVAPVCPHFGICGGCSIQHMSTEKQLEIKQQTLLDQ